MNPIELKCARIRRGKTTREMADAQTLMVFEEMSELQKELCKSARGKQNKEAIAEEIADVYIMLGQMILLHKCAEEVEEQKARKLERLEARILAAQDAQ